MSLGPDAQLYLSIADNYLQTGHFIQTARDVEDFVVPFGVPVLLTVFRALAFGPAAIVCAQYAAFGVSCFLLYKTERNLFGLGGLAPALYTLALLRAHLPLSDLSVEHYYLPLLCVILWLFSCRDMPREKCLIFLHLAGFWAFVSRPVLAPVYAAIWVYTIVLLVRRQCRVRSAAAFLLVPCLLLGVNTAMNRRETGELILLENYSGASVYLANNPQTKVSYYASSRISQFADEKYFAIKADPSLSPKERECAENRSTAVCTE